MTSSPAPMPRARRAMVRPSVPLATPTAPAVPMYAADSSSKLLTLGPRMTRPLRSTSSTARLDAALQLGVLPFDVHESDGHAMRLLEAGGVEPATYHSLRKGATDARPRRCLQLRSRRRARPLPVRAIGCAACSPSSTASSQWCTHLIGSWGLPAVFVLMLLESACIPVPSEAIMPFAGFAVSEGKLTLAGIVDRRRRRQPRRLLDRLRGRLLRRPPLRRPLGQVRAAAPAPPRHGAALVRPLRARRSSSSGA